MATKQERPERTVTYPAEEWWMCVGWMHRHKTEASAQACENKASVRKHGQTRTLAEDGHYYLSGWGYGSGNYEGRHASNCPCAIEASAVKGTK